MPVNLCLIDFTGFVDSIMGDVLDDASYALMEALSVFFSEGAGGPAQAGAPKRQGNTGKDGSPGNGRAGKGIDACRLADELAGICGVDPANFTLRTLVTMAQARQRSEWNRASAILAMIHNAHMASDFNPFKQESVMVIGREDAIKVFRQIAEGKPVTLPTGS